MLITAQTAIVIQNTPAAIWDYASDPAHWTASNPGEHFGLRYYSADNRPRTGVRFRQREVVAGLRADLRGHIMHAEPPRLVVWTGVARYSLLGGLVQPRIPEGGVATLEAVEGGTRMSHNVFMDFPDTLGGRLLAWGFQRFLEGPQAVYHHTYRELVFFKQTLDLPIGTASCGEVC